MDHLPFKFCGVFFVYFKDTCDVPQFQINFPDRIFLFYLHLNLFMPKNSGCINRLFLSLNTLNFPFKSMKNTIKCFLLKLKYIFFNWNYIYSHRQISHIIKILCWNNVVEIFTLDRETNGPRPHRFQQQPWWNHFYGVIYKIFYHVVK